MNVPCVCLLFLSVTALAAAEADPPRVSAADLQRQDLLDRQIRVEGRVSDVFVDELDHRYVLLVIQTQTGPAYAAARQTTTDVPPLQTLKNAEISVLGKCRRSNDPKRQFRIYLGPYLDLESPDSIRIIKNAPADPFNVPTLAEDSNLHPFQLQQLGQRKASGRVLATWKNSCALIETPTRRMMRIEFAEGSPPPMGTFVDVVGYPDTDSFRINLTRAVWRQTPPWPVEVGDVCETTAAAILTDGHGNSQIKPRFYGKTIRLTGIVRNMPGAANDNAIFQVENESYLLPVDASACRNALNDISVGCKLELTGLCIFNVDNCRPNAIFPRIDGFTLILRSTDDIRILSHPSWWTARRLVFALVVLLLVLVAILFWNRSLSVLAERRGRQLAEEQVGRATSELKVLERTRFSAELHDALSQTLSGIAMQLGAIKRFAKTDHEQMLQHLDIASRTLKSCRDEMRNLLWDLRSQVLDEPDIEKALRQILEPHLDETEVHIRFAVPRTRLTDSTARALFCIVRELTVNAIRHGHASIVRIAGSLENGRLLCSVRDNGCGFDPSTAPGAEEGHFGLQGIRERMDALNGTVTIESTRGKGTKVTISLAAPHEEEKT